MVLKGKRKTAGRVFVGAASAANHPAGLVTRQFAAEAAPTEVWFPLQAFGTTIALLD